MISSKPWFSMTITATWPNAPGLGARDGDPPGGAAVEDGGDGLGAPVLGAGEHAPRAHARAVTTTGQTGPLRLRAVFPQVLDIEGAERLPDLTLPRVHDVVDERRDLQDVDLRIGKAPSGDLRCRERPGEGPEKAGVQPVDGELDRPVVQLLG